MFDGRPIKRLIRHFTSYLCDLFASNIAQNIATNIAQNVHSQYLFNLRWHDLFPSSKCLPHYDDQLKLFLKWLLYFDMILRICSSRTTPEIETCYKYVIQATKCIPNFADSSVLTCWSCAVLRASTIIQMALAASCIINGTNNWQLY